jgi:hypothetical protein
MIHQQKGGMEMLSCTKKLKSTCFLLSGLLIIMGACATSPGPKQTSAKPTLVITPPSGKARSGITIEGSGFQPQEEVEVVFIAGHLRHSLGTRKVEVIKANDAGAFKVKSGIPIRTPPGTYTVEAVGNQGSMTTFQLRVTK